MNKPTYPYFILVTLLGVSMTTTSPAAYKNQNEERNQMGFMDTLSVMKRIFFNNDRTPKKKLPEIKPDFHSFLAPSEIMKFIWFGHSTFLMNVDNHIILVDPVFHHASPFSFMVKRFQPPVVSLKELPPVDTIVISHDHYDHLDKHTVLFYRDTDTHFLVPMGVGNHLREWGIPDSRITELNWHETATFKNVKFRATPAQHFSGRGFFDRNETLWASWIIEGEIDKIYYSGDSGYGPHFREIGEKYGPFDFAFLENGQYNKLWPDVHMQPEETLQAQIDLNAHTLIPVHWGMFDLSLHHWTEPIERTYTIASNWDIPILTPQLGEIVDRFNQPSLAWWEPFLKKNVVKENNHTFIPELAIK